MSSSSPCRLLDLPPELRLMIYASTFTPLPEELHHPKHIKHYEPTALLQLCHQTREEAAPQYAKWLDAEALGVYQRFKTYTETQVKAARDRLANMTLEELRSVMEGIVTGSRAKQRGLRGAIILKMRCEKQAINTKEEHLDRTRKHISNIDEKVAKVEALHEKLKRNIAVIQGRH